MQYFKLKEERAHGSRDFPLGYYYVDSSHPRYEMALHWHSEFEIIRVIKGQFKVWLGSEAPVTMKENDIVLVGCGMLHRGEPTDCVYECLVFDLGMLRRSPGDRVAEFILPVINHTVSVTPWVGSGDTEIRETVSRLMDEIRKRSAWFELRTYALLYNLIALLYENDRMVKLVSGQRDDRQLQTIMNLLTWIEDHYTEPVTLREMARVCGMNEKYLCRFFRRYTGVSPFSYVILLRIEAACNLLLEGELTIAETAYACGFSDAGYFTRIFREKKGMTPSAYRGLNSSSL